MKCRNCGADLKENASFCTECGTRISPTDPPVLFCTECGSKLGAEAKYCSKCGAPVHKSSEASNSSFNADSHVSPNLAAGAPASSVKKGLSIWHRLNLFCKVSLISFAVMALLLLISICISSVLSIVLSSLQLAIVIAAVLIHEGAIKAEKWTSYLLLVLSILLIALHFIGFRGSSSQDTGGSPAEADFSEPAPTESAVPEPTGMDSPPEVAATPFPTLYASRNAEAYFGENYRDVEAELAASGFSDIRCEEIADLTSVESNLLGTVESVAINGSSEFASDQEFGGDSVVVIRYHDLQKNDVKISIDFAENLFFSRYDITLSIDGEMIGSLPHGEDGEFDLKVSSGEHTVVFTKYGALSPKGQATLTVDSNLAVGYKISCYSDKISTETLYVDRDKPVNEGEIKIGFSSSDCKRKDYLEVEAMFKDLGFTNIELLPLYDIVFGITTEGEVKSVSLNGSDSFSRGDVVAADSVVTITYHLLEKDDPSYIFLTAASGEYTGKNYLDVEESFRELGFRDVLSEASTTTDSSRINDTVYYVSIDSKSFEAGDRFKPDAKVRISYYSVVDAPPVSYSTNDKETAKRGETGVYAYKNRGISYNIYYIIDFDEGYVYRFIDVDDIICDRVKIVSGTLNDVVIITYHDGEDVWSNGLHFKWQNQPDHLVMEDHNHFEFDFYTTDLDDALALRDQKTIIDY